MICKFKLITCLPTILASLLFWFPSNCPRNALIQVPNRHTVASIPGDLVIGILVPVHERPSPKQAQTRTCGAVREQYGIQRVEVAFKTIDSINADPKILPNITLGIEIRDSCWHSPIALEQSIEFIRDAMAASEQTTATSLVANVVAKPNAAVPIALATEPTISGAAATISNLTNSICAPLLLKQQQQSSLSKKVKNIVGVVGPASSTDTVQVQNLLQLFNMPQVGYSATSRDLSNKNFFKYFLRVVPSDKLQAQVLIDLMLAHNWTYITVAYTEGSYGSSLMNAFRERAQEVGICFATLESMPPNADDTKFDELIEAIQKHSNAKVVICMCEGRTVGRLFAGLKRKNITNEYLVVGSDGWSDRFDVVEKQEEFAIGGISIRIHSAYVHDFDDYYFSLNPFTNQRNPWFAEFWETRFQCNLEQAPSSANKTTMIQQQQQSQRPYVRPAGAKVYNRTCTGRESLKNNHKQDAKMAFVQKSIITMALGLDSMQRSICGPNRPGLCAEMLPVNGSTLLQHLMNVSFSFLNEEVSFDEQGDPPGKYEILNFQRRRSFNKQQQAPFDNSPAEGQLEPTGADYSISSASAKQPDLSGLPQPNRSAKKTNPLYDSYATLKVFRNTKLLAAGPTSMVPNESDGLRMLNKRQLSRRLTLQQQLESSPPASGYSSTNGYEYVHVGSWKSSDGLSLFGEIRWPQSLRNYSDAELPAYNESVSGGGGSGGSGAGDSLDEQMIFLNEMPKSVCSLPCTRGHAKKIQSDSVKCCWVCVPCRPNEYLLNEFKCKACEKGWWPNALQTDCDQIPIQFFDWRSMEGLTAISIALFGLSLTLATAFVFIRHNNTPVVKSSTRELSYMILFSMFLCYANTFFLIAKPRRETCFVTRILPGFAFAMMYGALVTKTNRIARILAGSKKKIITRRPRFMSATSQVAITWIIVIIECVIIVFMLIKEPADKMLDYPTDERVVLVCSTTTIGIIAPLGFDFFLIAMCTLYAFKTRNVPENFNEAKFIGFTMYTTLVIWIAFVAIYLSSDHKIITLCLCISFSALFALFLLFFPRCYIIIFKPEKNNRSFFTTTKSVRCHIGYQINTNNNSSASGNAIATVTGQQQALLCGTNSGSLIKANNFNCSLDYDDHQLTAPQMTAAGNNNNKQTIRNRPQQQPLSHDYYQHQQRFASLGFDSPLSQQAKDNIHGHNNGHPSNQVEWPNDTRKFNQNQASRASRSSSFRSVFNGLVNAFARHSEKKESDKVSSIQQHLKAIRHAENLDRQTHFRRSQVQRLVQRFDSTISGQLALDQQHTLRNSLGPTLGTFELFQSAQQHFAQARGGSLKYSGQHSYIDSRFSAADGERLLLALGQLIGYQQVWRLADMIKRYCQARESQSIGIIQRPALVCNDHREKASNKSGQQDYCEPDEDDVFNSESGGQQLRGAKSISSQGSGPASRKPLNLSNVTDRKLALTMLRFLVEVSRKSMEDLGEMGAKSSQSSRKTCPSNSADCGIRQDGATDLATAATAANKDKSSTNNAVVCKSALVSHIKTRSDAEAELQGRKNNDNLSSYDDHHHHPDDDDDDDGGNDSGNEGAAWAKGSPRTTAQLSMMRRGERAKVFCSSWTKDLSGRQEATEQDPIDRALVNILGSGKAAPRPACCSSGGGGLACCSGSDHSRAVSNGPADGAMRDPTIHSRAPPGIAGESRGASRLDGAAPCTYASASGRCGAATEQVQKSTSAERDKLVMMINDGKSVGQPRRREQKLTNLERLSGPAAGEFFCLNCNKNFCLGKNYDNDDPRHNQAKNGHHDRPDRRPKESIVFGPKQNQSINEENNGGGGQESSANESKSKNKNIAHGGVGSANIGAPLPVKPISPADQRPAISRRFNFVEQKELLRDSPSGGQREDYDAQEKHGAGARSRQEDCGRVGSLERQCTCQAAVCCGCSAANLKRHHRHHHKHRNRSACSAGGQRSRSGARAQAKLEAGPTSGLSRSCTDCYRPNQSEDEQDEDELDARL